MQVGRTFGANLAQFTGSAVSVQLAYEKINRSGVFILSEGVPGRPGTPCCAKVCGVSINLLFSRSYGFTRAHPRPQRCGSVALHHASLRSLTASRIVGISC